MELLQVSNRKVRLEEQKLGMFTSIAYIGSKEKSREAMYECVCRCGNKTIVSHGHLSSGHTVSCGCYKPNKVHSDSHSSLYDAWINIKQRCLNPNNPNYKNYGARGIRISEEFENNYTVFKDYMGERPSDEHSIERLDVNGNYERGNLVWADNRKQSMNRRKISSNTTGVTGVVRTTNHGVDYYRAIVTVDRKTRNRYFNINKYGEEKAFELAIKARETLVKEANANGALFTENHGK